MPLKRKFRRNEGKRLHRDSQKPEFAGMPYYESGSPEQLPNKPQQSRRQAPTEAHICPPFQPQIQKYFSFRPLEVSRNPDKTLYHFKK